VALARKSAGVAPPAGVADDGSGHEARGQSHCPEQAQKRNDKGVPPTHWLVLVQQVHAANGQCWAHLPPTADRVWSPLLRGTVPPQTFAQIERLAQKNDRLHISSGHGRLATGTERGRVPDASPPCVVGGSGRPIQGNGPGH